jgi:SAM-dependent methyltransferase
MTTFYDVAYAIGFTPWETSAEVDRGRLEGFFALEERELGGPGKALDVGCGSGAHSVTLAGRGWAVTGVDLVGRALAKARRRASAAGVAATFVRADATSLPSEVVGDGFDFVLDVGCFHGLRGDQQAAMARAVTARSRPEATMVLLAFGRPIGPRFMPTGATRSEIEAAYHGWRVVDEIKPPTDLPGLPRIARKAEPTFYRLRRG